MGNGAKEEEKTCWTFIFNLQAKTLHGISHSDQSPWEGIKEAFENPSLLFFLLYFH